MAMRKPKGEVVVPRKAPRPTTALTLNNQPDYFSLVLDRLNSTVDQDEADDFGVLKPSEYAFKMTRQLLGETYSLLNHRFPRAAVSSDSEGGVRVQWIGPDHQVRLIIASSKSGKSYIYHEYKDQYGLDEDVEAHSLAKWLTWFMQQ